MPAPWDAWCGKKSGHVYIDDFVNTPMGEVKANSRQELNRKDALDAMTYSSFLTEAVKHVTRAVNEAPFTPKSIEVSVDHRTVVVVWVDGTKTIVKRSKNDPDDIYMAFTAALAKRIFGTNSHVKKVIASKVNQHLPKEKKGDSNG